MSVNTVTSANTWFVEVNGEPKAFPCRASAIAFLRDLYARQESRWQVSSGRRRCRQA